MSLNKLDMIKAHKTKNIRSNKNLNLNNIKQEIKSLKDNQSGQGAAEYILLFGGVIVIAIAAILIYSSYFGNKTSDLNASQDINTIRENLTTRI